MKFKLLTGILATAISLQISGQNLVVNGSFEEIEKKPKNPGEIFLAPPWSAGTQAVPDLYSESAKDDRIKVPVNAYGDEKPKDGENYAGILIYSDREKEPRSYLLTKLKHPMLAGEYYCVKFHISFADLSKYATNNIGAYVSKDSIASEVDLILDYKPQIINSTNRVFEKQWDWEDICRIYVADGGEQYLTIGNFAKQDDIIKKSVKRPPGYTSTQIRDGYYYIDDISILPNATPENCKCEPGNFAFANLNKDETEFATDEADVPDKVIIGTTGEVHGELPKPKKIHDDAIVGFSLGKYNLDSKASAELAKVSAFLKENPDVQVKLIGHVDDSEKVVPNLAENRMDEVGKYLVSKGHSSKNISKENVKDSKPLDDTGLKENRGKNMVVEIVFSKN